MKCEFHPEVEASAVFETRCCGTEVPWCARCAFPVMDWLAVYGDLMIDCKVCGESMPAKEFLVSNY